MSNSRSASLYQTLGLQPGACEKEIRRAFRKLAFDLHPDRNKSAGAGEKFRRVRQAYETLVDPAFKQIEEAEIVVQEMERAAAVASRTHVNHDPGVELCRRITLPAPPARMRMFGLEETQAMRAFCLLIAASAATFVLSGVLGAWWVALVGVLLVACGGAVWRTRRTPWVLEMYGSGFCNGASPETGRIGWSEVRWLETDPMATVVDIEVTDDCAARLEQATGFEDVLYGDGNNTYLRLYLGDSAREVLQLFTSRTGLTLHHA